MPTPLQIAAGVIVDAEPEVTWRAAVDWPRQHEWIWAVGALLSRVIVPLAQWGLRSSLRRFARLLRKPAPQD
jgi:hypothetical protein